MPTSLTNTDASVLTEMAPGGESSALPPDIEARRLRLQNASRAIGHHSKTMDGVVFGYIGADGFISLIPIAGDIASGLTTFWLLAKAGEAKMPVADRLVIFGFGVADVMIGMIPVVGDVADFFFRAHAWNSERIQVHIGGHLSMIEDTRRRWQSDKNELTLQTLRDELFRGGRTRAQSWARLAVVVGLCAALLTWCSHEAELRHQRILACEQAGGWFCSLRN